MDQPSKGRRLLIMRHAKSDWGTPGEPDFDRPLAKRGQRDAPRMGEWLRAQGLVPDLVLASPARRAQETASKVCKVLDIEKQSIQWEPRIYDATPRRSDRGAGGLPGEPTARAPRRPQPRSRGAARIPGPGQRYTTRGRQDPADGSRGLRASQGGLAQAHGRIGAGRAMDVSQGAW